ncbi:hypothetical protein Taro_000015 [Colocasia esculenta]|uniref:Uncharacterized protein n=1 Tax=Colocasia esculenta TaxID=4460 RepID=A0A843TFJ1_COLES|nr:hypothetical protein [Colocasia esculenta]
MVFLTCLLGVSRADTWLFLPDLVEVRDVGACVVRLWSHVVAPVFHELLCLAGVCRGFASALCCFGPTPVAGHGITVVASAFVHSAGSAGVVFGLTRVEVEAFLALLLCRVVLLPLLLEFLLLWLVVSFPTRFECELQESVAAVAGCACCERGCWFARAAFGFVLSLHIRVGLFRACFYRLWCYLRVELGHVLVRFSQDGSWRFWSRFSPKLVRVV